MASNRDNSGRGNSPAGQSIPLRDLTGPPSAITFEGREQRRRVSGSSGSNYHTRLPRRPLITGTYERIEDSPSPTERTTFNLGHHPPPSISRQHGPVGEVGSPLDDLGGFAQAVSSVGLTFDGPRQATSSLLTPSLTVQRGDYDGMTDYPEFSRRQSVKIDSGNYLPSMNEDVAPLTDNCYLQPISGASALEEDQQDQNAMHTINLGGHTGSRLGDDLPNLESRMGRRRGSSSAGDGKGRSRSLSRSASSSALSRAGSMMRIMSQRVVNLSNEPEVVEQSIRRTNSLKNTRLEEPQALPAMSEYAHDELAGPGLMSEPPVADRVFKDWKTRSNPLRGKSLGIFAADNPLRMGLCDILVHPFTEPFILIVIIIQTVLLTVDSAQSVFDHPRSTSWGSTGLDYALFVIFVIYTLELIAKIIVSGFIINPIEYSTLDRSLGLRKALAEKARSLFTLHRQLSTKKAPHPSPSQPSLLNTFTGLQLSEETRGDRRQRQRVRLAHRAFMRHSFNRLDFLAVISFWISFTLSVFGYEFRHHVYVFRMLSDLRILRLLLITNGTSIILKSLKKAAPLLVHVAFLIGFFWLLFAIIGIQSFKSSLRRTCVWIDPQGQNNFTLNDPYNALQFCGGHLDPNNGNSMPWLYANGASSSFSPKGYLCPQGSFCIEGDNPYNSTVSFDNILNSLVLVFVVMTSNTFTDLLYYTTDTDYLASALFFAAGMIILTLWMVNLLVAVITSSLQVIREERKRSAFATKKLDSLDQQEKAPRSVTNLKRSYDKTEWVWIVIIAFDLVVQCLRTATMGDRRRQFIDVTETVTTLLLLIEIIFRLASDWRYFHRNRRNLVDLGLAVITCIIQIPQIQTSGRPYSVLTIFQVLRIYRVILAFPLTGDLIMVVFRNAVGLLNLILFAFLITYLAAIFAAELFRGQIPQLNPDGRYYRITFFHIYNSFLGMYQLLSSENWTAVLYTATSSTTQYSTAWISATFFIIWYILANFIILNMFIAVIQESFDISEDEKRLQQIKAFLQRRQFTTSSTGNMTLTEIFGLGRDQNRYRDPFEHGPANLELLLKDAVVHEFLNEEQKPLERSGTNSPPQVVDRRKSVQPSFLSGMWTKFTQSVFNREPNPFHSRLRFSRAYEDLDPKAMAKEVVSASEQRRRAQREYLRKNPGYNKSLFIFAPNNPIRRACQRIVGPGRGQQRFEGVDPYKPLWYAFSAFIYAAIIAMVLIACITTPLYQRDYFQHHPYSVHNWFVYVDLGFAILFTVEAIIKVIADGLFWTPNAYFRGSWGLIDGIVLITLWTNVITALYDDRRVSRSLGAFKALRALRLLNVSQSARDTFHSVFIVGGWKVISAAFVSMSFLIPFAIYSLQLFNGQMVQCNDLSLPSSSLSFCIGEYPSSPYNWNVMAPRVAANPYYNFDDFGNSLFILFQIVSQEGWIDVQWSAMSITGVGQQPTPFASQPNGLFFVVFNLLGSVFVLTLFVSVFMRNYTEQTGVAYLTAEQRSWLELRKLLRQISPSKRSINSKSKRWKVWCYRTAVKKHGRWANFVTAILLLHLLLLVLEFYPRVLWWDQTREALFLFCILVHISNVIIRVIGLGWRRFSRSSWDLFALAAAPGALVTTILGFIFSGQIFQQLNKLFLVAITLLVIPRNNQLDQLFKTAAASLAAIGNLLATWVVLFLVYAIAMTQSFGLTKFGASENNNLNFRDVPRALIFLFRTSCGEGWNQLMEDFATMRPPHCTPDSNFLNSDCGSPSWARSLFISWNIISMYIFVSLFVSLIFESFSYVYQRSSGLYAISREDIRRFKQAWATFDPDATSYISKEQFPRLLGELSGIFEMRIYDGEFTIGSIMERCRLNVQDPLSSHRKIDEQMDLKQLASIVNQIPVGVIRERRQRLNNFYEEVLVSADPERGISFSACLMILAHYKVINDSKSLRLEEFLRRRARMQRVEEAVRRNTVIGFFDTLYWSRQFRQMINAKRLARLAVVPHFAVPEILVESQDENQATTPQRNASSRSPSPNLSPQSAESRMPSRPSLHVDTSGVSLSRSSSSPSEWTKFSPSNVAHRPTTNIDIERQLPSDDSPTHSRRNSAVSIQDVMNSLDDSVWGQSLRRGFTQRRSRA